jgi:hypothetical protein
MCIIYLYIYVSLVSHLKFPLCLLTNFANLLFIKIMPHPKPELSVSSLSDILNWVT